MPRVLPLCLAALTAAPALVMAQAPAPRPPFPAPGSEAVWRGGADMAAALQAAVAATPAQGTVQILATDRSAFSLMRRGAPNNPLAHAGWTEVFYITDGGGIFESGGTVTRTPGSDVVTYTGTVQRQVRAGDVVVIPEGTPHRYRALDGSVTYLEVRFPNEPGVPPAPSSTPAPAPGTAVIVYEASALRESLDAASRSPSARATVPVLATDRYTIEIVRRGVGGAGVAHPGWNALDYIIDGGASFVSGGSLTPTSPPAVGGGATRRVRQGDVLVIPADTPHQYVSVDDSVTYFEVRMPNAAPTPRR